MPTELETILKKEMCYKLVAPTCLSCEFSKKDSDGYPGHTCSFNRLKDIPVLPGAVCGFYKERETQF